MRFVSGHAFQASHQLFDCISVTTSGDKNRYRCWKGTTSEIEMTRQHDVSSSYHRILHVCLSPWLMCNARSIWLPRCLMASIYQCQAGMIKELILHDYFHPLPSTASCLPLCLSSSLESIYSCFIQSVTAYESAPLGSSGTAERTESRATH